MTRRATSGVDRELRRQREQRTLFVGDDLHRRAEAPRAGVPDRRPASTRDAITPPSPGPDGNRARRPTRARPGRRRRIDRQAGPLGDDPLQLAHLQLRPLVAQQRQGDPLAPDVVEVDVDDEQALVVQRRREERLAGRRDDLRSRPRTRSTRPPRPGCRRPRTTSSAGRTSASASATTSPSPGPTSFVAARSRPGDDETLIRICAPSRASSCGTVRCQKSSQIAIPMPGPSRDGTARSRSPAAKNRRSSNRP